MTKAATKTKVAAKPEGAPAGVTVDPFEDFRTLFSFAHLQEGPIREASAVYCELAHALIDELPANREKTAGLRKLLEAKDCFVRSAATEHSTDTEQNWLNQAAAERFLAFFDSSRFKGEEDTMSRIGVMCEEAADFAVGHLPKTLQRGLGLQKLLEAKDCFARCMILNRAQAAATEAS